MNNFYHKLAFVMIATFILVKGVVGDDPGDLSSEEPTQITTKGLHNVYRITDKMVCGSSPDGESGFQSLKELGVKTIISVDGGRPDVTSATKFDMRYVHLPIGYDGIPRAQVLLLAKAVQELPGPIYIHCHHGKHRGPAAVAAIRLCLDDKCTIEMALKVMTKAGTDPRYQGLYDVPRKLVRPTNEELDKVSADFAEVAEVSDLAKLMVEIDARWDHLKTIQAADWKAPKDSPELDPSHEALMLAEQFKESARLPKVKDRPEQFRDMLTRAEEEASNLEQLIRLSKRSGKLNLAGVDESFQRMKVSCVQCHEDYRDKPQMRYFDRGPE